MRDNFRPFNDEQRGPLESSDPACATKDARPVVTDVRILATTDIHMQLLGHDYVQDKTVGHNGMAGLASLIKSARAEAAHMGRPCLLVDNGDILQGSALGDALAKMPVTPAHPIVAGLEAMGYDAIGIGNHDLDHGLTYLHRIAGLSPAPFISTNMMMGQDGPLRSSAMIECEVPLRNSTEMRMINIGFLSVLPQRTGIWNKPMLDGQATIRSAEEALLQAVPKLRAEGADVVILLAHMGIEDDFAPDDVRALANLPGIDAMIAGHTHRRLPGTDHAGLFDVDVRKGALGLRPAAMPGFNASDLAVLDLKLTSDPDEGWQVADYSVRLKANTSEIPADSEITAICAPAHMQTRAKLAEAVGHSAQTLHNFFSLAMPTQTCALSAAAKRYVVKEGLRGSKEEALPLLAAAAAHTAGGRGGPDHYLNVSAGTIYRRAMAGLNPYGNAICALRLDGATLRAWLEHTVGIYTQLRKGAQDQPLLRSDRPTFHFDTIYGVRYGVDPTQPTGARITSITLNGRDLRDDQPLLLATTQFRAAGGGGGPAFSPDQVVFHSDISLDEAMLQTLKATDRGAMFETDPWFFDCQDQVKAILRTAPQATAHIADVDHLSPEILPIDSQGFVPIRLTL